MTGDTRQCLPCVTCCHGWMPAEVLGHKLRPGHSCPHVSAKGCGIHEQRPQDPCRNFFCSWVIESSPLPEWMRPDLSGVIVLLNLPWEGEHVISAVPAGREIPRESLDWLMAYAQTTGRPMILYERTVDENGVFNGLKRFGYGDEGFRRKVDRMSEAEAALKVRLDAG
jgi:hypothetical protein